MLLMEKWNGFFLNNDNHHMVTNSWGRILGLYFTRHVLSLIFGVGGSQDGGQEGFCESFLARSLIGKIVVSWFPFYKGKK